MAGKTAGRRNIRLTVAYDGTNYHGFQRQKNAVAIAQVLEEKLALVFGRPVCLIAAGRTDTGVHAYGQVVNFFTDCRIPVERIPLAVNKILPPDIVVRAAAEAAPDFHARYSAIGKLYVYQIDQADVPDPFRRNYTWRLRQTLDPALMREALSHIEGTHDFSAFQSAGGGPRDPVKTIWSAVCAADGPRLAIALHGDGFLYHMVRNLVGSLVDVGRRRITVDDFYAVLAGKDRRRAGKTAPPQGLYLMRVDYAADGLNLSRRR